MLLPYTSGFHINEKLSLGFWVGLWTNDSVATRMDEGQSNNMALESTPHALICMSSSRNDLGRLSSNSDEGRTTILFVSCSSRYGTKAQRQSRERVWKSFELLRVQ